MGLARLKTFVLENSPAWLVVALLRRFVTKSDYQSKRESITFFQRANVAYGAHKQRRSVRLLRVAFGLLGDELPMYYVRLIIGATNQTQRDASRRSALSVEILAATKALAIDITDATGWYQLSRGLFSVGYFRAAWVARENSIELSIHEGEAAGAGANAVGRAIQAHLERRNFAEVEALLARSTGRINESGLRDIRDYLDMMQNKYVMPPLDPNSPNFEAEKLFSELITGKSVALVGPGSPSGHHGNEIDSADTVVRIKYVGREHLPPQEFHGHRCDINYFGNTEIESLQSNLSAEEHMKMYGDLKLTLSSGSLDLSIGNSAILNLSSLPLTYRTPAYAGVKVIYAICRLKILSMHIFGLNFYANKVIYSVENQKFLENSAIKLGHNSFDQRGIAEQKPFYRARDLFVHDPVSNFCFAQNLYQAGLFEIEPYGASILALTPYQYVERLEEMLGDW